VSLSPTPSRNTIDGDSRYPRPAPQPGQGKSRNVLWKRDLRLWREDQARSFENLQRVLALQVTRDHFQDLCHKSSGQGRARALTQLRKRIDPWTAGFKCAGDIDGRMVASWEVIRLDDAGAGVCFWRLEGDRGLRVGLSEFEAMPHAIKRFFQRLPAGDLTRALIEANDCIREAQILRHPDGTGVVVDGAGGAFVGRVVQPPVGMGTRYVVGQTWVRNDMLQVSDYPGYVLASAYLEARLTKKEPGRNRAWR
jgi:hypothetical protein